MLGFLELGGVYKKNNQIYCDIKKIVVNINEKIKLRFQKIGHSNNVSLIKNDKRAIVINPKLVRLPIKNTV